MDDSLRYQLEGVLGLLCQGQLPETVPDFCQARKDNERSARYLGFAFAFFIATLMSALAVAVPVLGAIQDGFTPFGNKMIIYGCAGSGLFIGPAIWSLLKSHKFSLKAEKNGWKKFSECLSLLYAAADVDHSVVAKIPSSPEALVSKIQERVDSYVSVITELESGRSKESVLESEPAQDERVALRHLVRLVAALKLMGTGEWAFMLESGPDDEATNVRAKILYRELFERAKKGLVLAAA